MTAKEYRQPMPADWWLRRKTYTWFMVRELTAVFVGGYAVFLLALVRHAHDQAALDQFVEGLKSPLSVLLHVVALAMAVFHSITWFNLSPKAMVVWRGEKKVSPTLIVASNYVAWIVLSIVVGWIAITLG